MKYLGHKSEDEREQTLLEHLHGTSALCTEFAKAFNISLSWNNLVYHFKLIPVKVLRLFDSLNENTIITAIGA